MMIMKTRLQKIRAFIRDTLRFGTDPSLGQPIHPYLFYLAATGRSIPDKDLLN